MSQTPKLPKLYINSLFKLKPIKQTKPKMSFIASAVRRFIAPIVNKDMDDFYLKLSEEAMEPLAYYMEGRLVRKGCRFEHYQDSCRFFDTTSKYTIVIGVGAEPPTSQTIDKIYSRLVRALHLPAAKVPSLEQLCLWTMARNSEHLSLPRNSNSKYRVDQEGEFMVS
jgi:hypothetical protein